MVRHVMIDCETLGTKPGCVIATIGAVRFDPETGALGKTFSAAIDIAASQAHGLTIDAETVTWWLEQSPQAITAAFFGERKSPLDVLGELLTFFEWPDDWTDILVWSHGATADVVWLEAWFRALGGEAPWTYRAARDTRTLFDLAGVKVKHAPGAVLHNGLDDACAQALAVCEAYRILGLGKAEVA